MFNTYKLLGLYLTLSIIYSGPRTNDKTTERLKPQVTPSLRQLLGDGTRAASKWALL